MSEYVISISYGNYLIQNGGTDKVIREHREMFNRVGCDYLFLFPVARRVKIGKIDINIRYWGLDINEKFVGIFKFNNLINQLNKYQNRNKCKAIFIHHTWRIEEQEVRTVVSLNNAPVYYYLHDFQAICDNRNFLDKDEKFCGYSINGYKCNTECVYYKKSLNNRSAFIRLLEYASGRITCVGPSVSTREIYAGTFQRYKNDFIDISHQKFDNYIPVTSKENEKLRIAFIGAQNSIKGWGDFKALLPFLLRDDTEVFYLGTGTDIPEGVQKVNVSVREQGRNAMLNALKENNIDVVLLLSSWPETYSYTFFESFMAGCFVITYAYSGNMADQVRILGNGECFKSYECLKLYFEDFDNFKNNVSSYRMKSNRIPGVAEPNDEIVIRVIPNKSTNAGLDMKQCFWVPKKSIIADILYRKQNGTKLYKN